MEWAAAVGVRHCANTDQRINHAKKSFEILIMIAKKTNTLLAIDRKIGAISMSVRRFAEREITLRKEA